MKQRKNIGIRNLSRILVLSLMLILFSSFVTALCNFESLRYYGTCPFDGDIKVYDSQNTLIVEQLFSIDQGCYEGRYSMQVPGGREVDCVLNNGENVRFELSGVVVGYDVWEGEAVKELNLERNPKMPGEQNNLYVWITVIGIILIVLLIFVSYVKKINR